MAKKCMQFRELRRRYPVQVRHRALEREVQLVVRLRPGRETSGGLPPRGARGVGGRVGRKPWVSLTSCGASWPLVGAADVGGAAHRRARGAVDVGGGHGPDLVASGDQHRDSGCPLT